MSKSSVTYWNPLAPEYIGQWKAIEGMKGLAEELTLSIDKERINKAKSQNINLSSFLEIRLIDYLSDKEKCSRRDSPLIV